MSDFPVIDVAPLRVGGDAAQRVGFALDEACRDTGFFYVVGHGVDPALTARLDTLAREFFALDPEEKSQIAMARGGRAWRGWFPVGAELTSGAPDAKEGIYFGVDLPAGDPRPLHGPNLYPARPADFRAVVRDYLNALTEVGHLVAGGLALGLGLGQDWFRDHLTADPTILFRIFHYPAAPADRWGVAEHTDYGLLTLLCQDSTGGLEVRTRDGWTTAAPIEGSFVCNLGDMLERLTAGRYRSTAHRVRNASGSSRLSFPFFFDPSWDADVRPIPRPAVTTDRPEFIGTYGDYLVGKVAKVFPDLGAAVLNRATGAK